MADDVTPFHLVTPKRKKREPKNPPEPKWHNPAEFPVDAAAILKKSRISKRQFSRYAEQVLLFLVTHGSADYAKSLLSQVRYGDKDGMRTFSQILGLVKNESAVTVNLHQNNQLNIESPQEARDFDSIIRALDQRDRQEGSIETTAVPLLTDPFTVDLTSE